MRQHQLSALVITALVIAACNSASPAAKTASPPSQSTTAIYKAPAVVTTVAPEEPAGSGAARTVPFVPLGQSATAAANATGATSPGAPLH